MFKKLDQKVMVAPQIRPDQVAELKNLGITDFVCHRPDHEEPGQPLFADVEAQAKRHGFTVHFDPVEGRDGIQMDDIEAFRKIIKEAKGKIFAYCRTGTRCTALWLLARSEEIEPGVLLQMAREQGYDLQALTPLMRGIFENAQHGK